MNLEKPCSEGSNLQSNELVKRYSQLFIRALGDPVEFARTFLGFEPFPYQEKFLGDESPLIAACCGRQVGKTTLAAIKAIHFALAKWNVRILIISAGLRQSMILFDRILDFTQTAIPARALMVYRTRTKIRFANGSEILVLPCGRNGSTIRGFTADMVILDECNFIPRIVIDFVVRPTMITRTNAKLIMISTPWMKDYPFYDHGSVRTGDPSSKGWDTARHHNRRSGVHNNRLRATERFHSARWNRKIHPEPGSSSRRNIVTVRSLPCSRCSRNAVDPPRRK